VSSINGCGSNTWNEDGAAAGTALSDAGNIVLWERDTFDTPHISTRIKLELTNPAQTFIKIEVAFPQRVLGQKIP
jgi:hypothetical protein